MGNLNFSTTMVYFGISEKMKIRAMGKITDSSITTIPKERKQDKGMAASLCGIKPIKGKK